MFLREPRLPKNDRKNNRNQSNAYTLGLLYRLFQGDASSSTGPVTLVVRYPLLCRRRPRPIHRRR